MGWLSTLDQDLALQAGEGIETADIPLVAGTALYDLPVGGDWDSIVGMWIDGSKTAKLSGLAYGRYGVSRQDGQLLVYPTPTAAGTLRIAQQTTRAAYTDKANDDLYLPAPFAAAYQWYIAGKIYLLDRDTESYNNMTLLYNNSIEGFWNRRAQTGAGDGLAVTGLW